MKARFPWRGPEPQAEPQAEVRATRPAASPPEAPTLEARGLSAGHGGSFRLDGIDLSIAGGCFTALLGPNGSGKSTLLASLARLLPAQTGQVLLSGHDIATLPPRETARRLGLLPQQPRTPEAMTVADLVARGRFPHQGFLRQWSTEDEAALTRALALTHLEPLRDHRLDRLSGGQRQRAWIAMVLAQETPLLLLDEPTSFLDLHHQVEILSILAHLVRMQGRTVVCVLHDLNMALQYADHLVFLKDGRIRHHLTRPEACSTAIVREIYALDTVRMHHPELACPVFLPRTQKAVA